MRCPSTMGPKHAVHAALNNVFTKFAQRAQVTFKSEASVSDILGVSTAFAATRYPRHPNAAQRAEAENLGRLHDQAASLPLGPERDKLLDKRPTWSRLPPRTASSNALTVFSHTPARMVSKK